MPAEPLLTTFIGNPAQNFDSSIYNNILNGEDSQYRVKITSGQINSEVIGLLTNNLSFNLDAKWEASNILESVVSNFNITKKLYEYSTMMSQYAGYADPSKIGLSSKKLYQNSGYLDIPINFRVVDWQEDGTTMFSTYVLAAMCLPKRMGDKSLKDLIISLTGQIFRLIKNEGDGKEKQERVLNSWGKLMNKIGSTLGGSIVEGFNNLAGADASAIVERFFSMVSDPQFAVLASSPHPVMIEIGNYFKHSDMVIENLGVEFSKQCTSLGPLYVDFSIKASSRKAILLNTDGENSEPELGFTVKGKRVINNRYKSNISSRSDGPV